MNSPNQTHRQKRLSRRRRGFTLIELMAAMAVFSILLVMLLRVFSGTSKTFNTGAGLSKQTTEARLVLDYIAQDLQEKFIELKPSTTTDEEGGPTSELFFMDDFCQRESSIVMGPSGNENKLMQQILLPSVEPAVPMLDHVLDFEVNVYHEGMLNGGGMPTPAQAAQFMQGNAGVPMVDGCSDSPVIAVIYLETLSDHYARINDNAGAAFDAGLHSQKFYRTVYLRNYTLTQN